MFLVYVDEYGDSGARLDDTRQPIFGLVAALIPADKWIQAETESIELVLEIRDALGLEETPRLHIVSGRAHIESERQLSSALCGLTV